MGPQNIFIVGTCNISKESTNLLLLNKQTKKVLF